MRCAADVSQKDTSLKSPLKFKTSGTTMESISKHTTSRHEAQQRMNKHLTMPLDLAMTELEAKRTKQAIQVIGLPPQPLLDTSFPFQMIAQAKRQLPELLDTTCNPKKACVVNAQTTRIVLLKEEFALLRRSSHIVKLEPENHFLKRASIAAVRDLQSWQAEHTAGGLSQLENPVETPDPMTWDEVMVGLIQRQAPQQKSELNCFEQLPPQSTVWVPPRFPEPCLASVQVVRGQHNGFVEMRSQVISGEIKLCSLVRKPFLSSKEGNLATLLLINPERDDLTCNDVMATTVDYWEPTDPR